MFDKNNCYRLSSLGNRCCNGVRSANGLMRSDLCEKEMRKQDWTGSLRPPYRADKCLPIYQELWSKGGLLEEPWVPEKGEVLVPLPHSGTGWGPQGEKGDHGWKHEGINSWDWQLTQSLQLSSKLFLEGGCEQHISMSATIIFKWLIRIFSSY